MAAPFTIVNAIHNFVNAIHKIFRKNFGQAFAPRKHGRRLQNWKISIFDKKKIFLKWFFLPKIQFFFDILWMAFTNCEWHSQNPDCEWDRPPPGVTILVTAWPIGHASALRPPVISLFILHFVSRLFIYFQNISFFCKLIRFGRQFWKKTKAHCKGLEH